jgi:GAF domain-containing protein
MSQAKPLLIVPSPEFIALCHSQVALLIQGMKADWTVVYLTEGLLNEPPTNLIPVVVYPQNEEGLNRSVVLHELPKVWGSEAIFPLLSSDISDKSVQMDYPTTDWPAASFPSQNQMILPLIYKDVMLGLLVIGRRVGKWHNHDLTQFERIAKTIALARFMDQRQGWY